TALLDSIDNQDYSKELLEVIIADGMSDDGTREIIANHIKEHLYIKLIDNEQKIAATGLNKAIKISKGDVIIRMDVHSIYPNNYFSILIDNLIKTGADNVGGMCKTCPGNDSIKAKAIALAMSHPFGVGNSQFRITNKTEPYEVDTVPFGCYKRSVFEKIGLFDEVLVRNQDNEFNERLIKNGGKIYLIPTLKIKYFARENFTKLWKMNYQYALFGPAIDRKLGKPSRLRKYIPSIFILSIILPFLSSFFCKKAKYIAYASGLAYFVLSFICSCKLAMKEKNFILLFHLIIAFLTAHVAYGVGFLRGYFFIPNNSNPNIQISR
ncbi:MAG: glycosyltransferase family 2 protein, partial [Candidatus Riflebacteria bacterium]|nr:glycosyltransferase family 2 protein [Candidatus Riflebacteria bacterium]